jgi:hypothetical protein
MAVMSQAISADSNGDNARSVTQLTKADSYGRTLFKVLRRWLPEGMSDANFTELKNKPWQWRAAALGCPGTQK